MSPKAKAREQLPPAYLRIPARKVVVVSPLIRFSLGPGDRSLVSPGQTIAAGTPIIERTQDVELVDAGRLDDGDDGGAAGAAGGTVRPRTLPTPVWKSVEQPVDMALPVEPARPAEETAPKERRRPPVPGKWWVGGDERRGKATGRREPRMRVGGTLLFELEGRWHAAAGEHHDFMQAPTPGTVVDARNGIVVTLRAAGAAIAGVAAEGSPTRGTLDVPKLVDGELRDATLDVGKAGAIVVAGGRISAEALTRARAMSIRGMVAGALGWGELRDLAASEARQRAGLHNMPPFAVLALDGHQRRPIATPILNLLTSLAGREVAIVSDPPLLLLDALDVPLPEMPPDWVRVRSGPHAGREGRWLGSAGLYRFRAGIHLEAAKVRLGEDKEPTIVALADLERFVF
jgi:hypothetical protein